jgi:hypothetical protein
VISSLGKNPEREKVIDFSAAYAPFYLAVFGPPDAAISTTDDLKGKTISVTRGAIEDIELTAVAPKEATIKRFEDNNSTIAAYLAGQVDLIASGNVVMVAISERKPETGASAESEAQGFAGLRRREQERAGAAGQGQPDPRGRQGRRRPGEKRPDLAERTAACRPLTLRGDPWLINSISCRCCQYRLLLRGALFTLELTAIGAVLGSPWASWARWCGRGRSARSPGFSASMSS